MLRASVLLTATQAWEQLSVAQPGVSASAGLRSCQPHKYYVLIQADMKIHEEAFNMRLTMPMEVFPDIMAVSARCTHAADAGRSVGRCGADVASRMDPVHIEQGRWVVHIRDTVNRGPLAVRADMLIDMGFLDEQNFYLGHDDHNLCFTAYLLHAWKCAYYPIDFHAPLEDGSTRSTGANNVTEYLSMRKQRSNHTSFQSAKAEVSALSARKAEDRALDADSMARVHQMWSRRVQRTYVCSGSSGEG